MSLFFKEHAFLIFIQMIQFGSIAFLLYMDGYSDVKMLAYLLSLGFFFLGIYLTYHYVTRRNVYRRLERPMNHLDEAMETTGNTPVGEALDDLLKQQFHKFQQEIMETHRQKEEHMTFMERWVHQMKTPLSVIELTAKEVEEPASSNIREETDRMKNGLQNVLYMARMRSIEDDFKIEPVSLEEGIQEVVAENKRYFIRSRVYPKLETSELFVETDRKWLVFLVHQLLQNAVKYSEGKADQVIVRNYTREHRHILEVEDFGIGIPPEDEKRVFDPFFTGVHGREYRESTGMGLYLAKEIADYLEHDIDLDTVAGEGTRVRIVFSEPQSLLL
ncbi:sensor histidine kinase [Salimicrobium halophilum]|uniref:histidine kinase n=1 Tax=Salimicrobium halophilum TaxID=86666 RepID=A0A1G8URP9_9BACI|nr:sensor histidine kinase [Salimicrobium halophilum]SDJ56409.1 Signal transduction histidine kinase [Salimicrobium halophilum]